MKNHWKCTKLWSSPDVLMLRSRLHLHSLSVKSTKLPLKNLPDTFCEYSVKILNYESVKIHRYFGRHCSVKFANKNLSKSLSRIFQISLINMQWSCIKLLVCQAVPTLRSALQRYILPIKSIKLCHYELHRRMSWIFVKTVLSYEAFSGTSASVGIAASPFAILSLKLSL